VTTFHNISLRCQKSRASRVRQGRPSTMIWLRRCPSGLIRIGFISTVGSIRAAAACTAVLRAISPPSRVTAALLLIFCALKGATRNPCQVAMRQSAVTRTLLPTEDAVPSTIMTGAVIRSPSRLRSDERSPQAVAVQPAPTPATQKTRNRAPDNRAAAGAFAPPRRCRSAQA
jgi:hypothetical protein